MKNWITIPKREGITSRQAHVNIPLGIYERELGREGFFGPSTHMYHKKNQRGGYNVKEHYVLERLIYCN